MLLIEGQCYQRNLSRPLNLSAAGQLSGHGSGRDGFRENRDSGHILSRRFAECQVV